MPNYLQLASPNQGLGGDFMPSELVAMATRGTQAILSPTNGYHANPCGTCLKASIKYKLGTPISQSTKFATQSITAGKPKHPGGLLICFL
ncbi:hypothetical protein C5Y96_16890 [Blastopirellula marina]|uniref:Uncharacterized protein n=1 Tax=Blastopirellula marina TaxID=124 RepID=A0A2S8F7E0_9BACT|nr:hypothetical protein C5Y96_16890 [Blastopirellula marina]RCS48475.1 hypothetical protein DTL36_16910 [Bremerella cremea]